MEETLIKGLPVQEYFKNWRETHKDYGRNWYLENKEDFLKKLLEPIQCECGFTCGKTNLKRHQKSKLHLKKLNTLEKKE